MWKKFLKSKWHNSSYYMNITFPERLITENIIPRNVIINQGAAINDIFQKCKVSIYKFKKCFVGFSCSLLYWDNFNFTKELLENDHFMVIFLYFLCKIPW